MSQTIAVGTHQAESTMVDSIPCFCCGLGLPTEPMGALFQNLTFLKSLFAPVWPALCHPQLCVSDGWERHFQPGPSRQFEWTGKKALPQPEEGGDKICSLTEATVTAMTRVETCYYFLVPLSWRQCQVSRTELWFLFLFTKMVRLKGDKERGWKHQLQNI